MKSKSHLLRLVGRLDGVRVGDAVAGSIVYVESRETNANRVIGVQRASFYGDVANGLYSGTIIDHDCR